jgi:ABC-type sugar transport system permease subunit
MPLMAMVEAVPASTANSEPASRAITSDSPMSLLRRGRLLHLDSAVFILPALLVYGLFTLWPLIQVFWPALHRWDGYGPQIWVGLGNVQSLWGDPIFRQSLSHSMFWELGAMGICTGLGLGLALLLTRSRASDLILSVLLVPALLPPVVVAATWVIVGSPQHGVDALFRDAGFPGLAQSWLGDPHLALGFLFVAWLWSALGIGTLILRSALQAIGPEYMDMARLEGAGSWWCFRHIALPGARRALVVVALINVALSAQVFDLIFVTSGGGPGYATMILPLDAYGRAFGGQLAVGQGATTGAIQVMLGLVLAAAAVLLIRRGEGLDTGERLTPAAGRTRLPHTFLALVSLAVMLLPLVYLAIAAVQPGRSFSLGTGGASLDPRTWALGNFHTVWSNGMAGAIGTSLLLGIAVVIITLLVAPPAGIALNSIRSRRLQAIAALLLVTGLLQPTPVLIIPLFSLLHQLNLLNSVWGIILPEVARALPFAVLVLWGFLAALPREVLDASETDGASLWQRTRHISLPLALPALAAAGIWSFVLSWNEYLVPTLVSQDGSIQTVPTLLATYIGTYDTQLGLLASGSLLALLPGLIIYVVLRRPAAAGLGRIVRRAP